MEGGVLCVCGFFCLFVFFHVYSYPFLWQGKCESMESLPEIWCSRCLSCSLSGLYARGLMAYPAPSERLSCSFSVSWGWCECNLAHALVAPVYFRFGAAICGFSSSLCLCKVTADKSVPFTDFFFFFFSSLPGCTAVWLSEPRVSLLRWNCLFYGMTCANVVFLVCSRTAFKQQMVEVSGAACFKPPVLLFPMCCSSPEGNGIKLQEAVCLPP